MVKDTCARPSSTNEVRTPSRGGSLPTLLKKLEGLYRQHIEIEGEIARIKNEILAAGTSEPKKRRPRAMSAETIELIKPVLKVLRDTGMALRPCEIAERLELSPSRIPYRLHKAVAAGFVVKVDGGRYRVVAEVPAL